MQLRPPAVAVERPDAAAAWLLNIRADPRVQVRLHDGRFNGAAREVTDPAELAVARQLLTDVVCVVDFGECAIHLGSWPTPSKVRDLHRYWFDTGTPIAIDLHTS